LPGPAQAWRAGPCVTATVGLPACHPGILADIPPGAAIDDDPIFIAASGEAKRRRFSITKNLTFFRIGEKGKRGKRGQTHFSGCTCGKRSA
jgi:hypothetical protein